MKTKIKFDYDTFAIAGNQPIPLLIAGTSSTTAIILSRTLAPLSLPVVSFITVDRQPLVNSFIFHQEANPLLTKHFN